MRYLTRQYSPYPIYDSLLYCLRHLYAESSRFACIFRTSPHVRHYILYTECSSLEHGDSTTSSSLSMLLGPPAYHLHTLYNDGGLAVCSLLLSTTPPEITGIHNNGLSLHQTPLSAINTTYVCSCPSVTSGQRSTLP